MCSHVYFNFCVNFAAPWYIMYFGDDWCIDFLPFDKLSLLIFLNFFSIFFNLLAETYRCNLTTSAHGTDLPPFFFKLSVYISIFNKIALLFHLIFLTLICTCQFPNNLKLTTIYRCQQNKGYPRKQVRFRKKRWINEGLWSKITV